MSQSMPKRHHLEILPVRERAVPAFVVGAGTSCLFAGLMVDMGLAYVGTALMLLGGIWMDARWQLALLAERAKCDDQRP